MRMLRLAPVIALAALAGASWAQTGPSVLSPAGPAEHVSPVLAAAHPDQAVASLPVEVHKPYRQRFEAANTTHDGRLTREQARAAKMTLTVRRFDEIDRGHKGYVTLDDLKAYMTMIRAQRRPAPAAAPTPAKG
jgi:hypothetical protein